MTKLRVLVVEDSLTVRKRLIEVLSDDPELEVVGEAADGKRGIELCQSLRPDVVTLDMILPIMSGLAATEYIMAYCPTPILIVSASVNRGELFKTYEALAAGAVDVLDKPVGDDDAWEETFVRTVKLVARIKVITHPRARLAGLQRIATATATPTLPNGADLAPRPRVVAIGVSTGGPAALVEILEHLPATYPIPILIVLHLGKLFAPAFADWLDGLTPLKVTYASGGEVLAELPPGRVLLAPPKQHLVVESGRLRLTGDPERHSCRPSVDVLFESIAKDVGRDATACLLTGMGKDGARGLLAIRRAGGTTIAQDEATSVVYGMPREAVLLGAAEKILGLDKISAALLTLSNRGRAVGHEAAGRGT